GGQREQDDPNRGVKLTQGVHQLQALVVVGGFVAEANINDRDVKALALEGFERFGAAACRFDVIALGDEQSGEHPPEFGRVVYKENLTVVSVLKRHRLVEIWIF